MKRNPLFQFAAILTLSLVFVGCTQQSVDVTDEIAEVNKAFMEAFNSGDMTALAQLYTENAKLFPPNSEIIEGRTTIEGFWQSMVGMGVEKVKLETTTATGFGNTAIEEGKSTVYATGGLVIDEGKYIVIWVKVNDQWQLDRDIWNTSYPPPTQASEEIEPMIEE